VLLVLAELLAIKVQILFLAQLLLLVAERAET